MDDSDLISAARAGDGQAYAELHRRHSPAALRFARSLAGPSAAAEDLVTDAFARVLAALHRGDGPDEWFRPYLYAAIRGAVDDAAGPAAERPTDGGVPVPLPPGDNSASPAIDGPMLEPADAAQRRLVAAAFGDLPERWQLALWHTEVEREKSADVARLLGISPDAVASLATRAREGLRERYLQVHRASATDPHCRITVDRLGAYTANTLSAIEAEQVQVHLDGCAGCRLLFVDLAGGPGLGRVLGPVVLGSAAAAYLTASAAKAGGPIVLRQLLRRRDAQIGAAAVAAAAAVALVLALAVTPTMPNEPAAAGPSTPETPSGSTPSDGTTPSDGAPDTTTPETSGAATDDAGPGLPGVQGPPAGGPPAGGPPAGGPPAGLPPAGVPPAEAAGLRVTLEPVKALVRGRHGTLRLTVTNELPGPAGARVPITATISLPAGVRLRPGNPGQGWTCTGTSAIVTCTRGSLGAGQTSRANLRVSVASDAADGVPTVQVSGAGIPPTTAVASQGVVDEPGRGRGARG